MIVVNQQDLTNAGATVVSAGHPMHQQRIITGPAMTNGNNDGNKQSITLIKVI